MIRRAGHAIVGFFGSASLATGLLAVVAAWVVVAAFIPQGAESAEKVAAWAAAYPVLEPAVRAVGLHHAFSAPIFTGIVLALALCTAVCAWRRTTIAVTRARVLRKAAGADEASVTDRHDLEIACDPSLGGAEVLADASETLRGLGIKVKRRDGMLSSVSSPWSVWGSPVFHWALLVLMLAVLVGSLQRSEGLMGVAVGETKADTPASYGMLVAGPLHDWRGVQRSIRVDAFDPTFRSGGIDRGPTPTVSVLDATGQVIKAQRVYPNATLQTGSLTIYPNDYGLTAVLSAVDASGTQMGRGVVLVDFSATATAGTATSDYVDLPAQGGGSAYRAFFTVPLDRVGAAWDKRIPKGPQTRMVVVAPDGTTVSDRIVQVGETVSPVGAQRLRLDGIGYYARLSVVDDASIPLIYAGLIAAMIGLTITVFARQQIVIATVIKTSEGPKLAVRVRLWRNASSSRDEIASELAKALDPAEQGSTP